MSKLSKFFLKSKAIWGIILTAVPTISNFVDSASPFVPPNLQPYIQAVGLALATFGRWTSSAPLSFDPGK